MIFFILYFHDHLGPKYEEHWQHEVVHVNKQINSENCLKKCTRHPKDKNRYQIYNFTIMTGMKPASIGMKSPLFSNKDVLARSEGLFRA